MDKRSGTGVADGSFAARAIAPVTSTTVAKFRNRLARCQTTNVFIASCACPTALGPA